MDKQSITADEEKELAIAALSSGDINTIQLAFILLGKPACNKCGYIINHCKCDIIDLRLKKKDLEFIPNQHLGVVVERKPSDYSIYSNEEFVKENNIHYANVYGLFSEPQNNCSNIPFAYKMKNYFIQSKHVTATELIENENIPLYKGPCVNKAKPNPEVMYIFPQMFNKPKPFLYCLGTGTMEKCNTCQHNRNWLNLNELTDSVRLKIQTGLNSIIIDSCRLSKASFYLKEELTNGD